MKFPVPFDKIANRKPAESSESIRERVVSARKIQQNRYKNIKGVYCNSQINGKLLHKFASPDATGLKLLKSAMERRSLSARAYDRILKVSRTIADIDASEQIKAVHLAEAINYRNLDRENWVFSK